MEITGTRKKSNMNNDFKKMNKNGFDGSNLGDKAAAVKIFHKRS
jgi:hypothetical protein